MTADTAPNPVDEEPVDRPGAAARYRALSRPLTAVVVAQAAWFAWSYAQGWFLQADLSNLVESVGRRPGWGYLSAELGGHFAPVARLVYWLLDQLSPLDYGLTVALRVGCQALSTVLLYRLLIRLVHSELVVLAVVTVYAFNPMLQGGTAMFTPGITIGIGQVFALLALHAHLRRDEGGSWHWAAAAGGLLALALLCSEQWIVTALAFPLLSMIHTYPGSLVRRVVQLVRAWRTWLLAAVPVLGVSVATLVYVKPVGASTPALTAAYHLLRNSWLYSVGPSSVGGPLEWYADATTYIPTAAPSDTVVMIGQIGFAAIVLVGLRRTGWRSLAGWLLPLVVWAVSMLLVGYRGYSELKDLVAITPRYMSALALFFAIGAALALSPDGVAGAGSADPRPAPGRPRRLTEPRIVGAGVLVAAVVVASLVSGARFANIFGRLPAERYVQNLTASATASGARPNVYDTPVPPWLISPVEPKHRVTDLLRLSRASFIVDDPGSTPLIAAADGRLVRSVFVPAASVRGQAPCGTAVRGAGVFTYPLVGAVARAEWYLHLQLFQQASSSVSVELVDARGAVAKPVTGSTLHLAPLAALNLRLPLFAPTAVRIRSTDPTLSLCLAAVQVGAPFPVPGS